MDTGKEKYLVLEWTIKNFSCWNNELHDKVIKSTESCTSPNFWMELYPRNLSGHGEHLVVRLHCSTPELFVGDLSFIDSDGSLLCTQQVDSKEVMKALQLAPGPEFKEVVAQIRKKEDGDRLTLRWRKRNYRELVECMTTTIDAFDVALTITSKVLGNLNSTPENISILKYPLDEERKDMIVLQYAEDHIDSSKILLKLTPYSCEKKVSVLARVSVLSNEDLVRTEENEHLFRDKSSWNFCSSLTKKDVVKGGFSLNLYFVITPSRKYKHCISLLHQFSERVHEMPTSSSKPPETSVSEESSSSSKTTDTSNNPENSVTVLTEELMCLYQDQDFSDFQLKCGDVSFPVHRAILSSRSPVFKTMFSTDMKEAGSGCMDIVDLDPSTLSRFLAFLYTGAVEDLQGESALKLYYAADKYRVPTLKRECVSALCAEVSISNVCDILSLADKHQDDQLTSAAHDFFLKNYNEILASKEWASFMKSEPMLALETVTHFGENIYGKRSETS